MANYVKPAHDARPVEVLDPRKTFDAARIAFIALNLDDHYLAADRWARRMAFCALTANMRWQDANHYVPDWRAGKQAATLYHLYMSAYVKAITTPVYDNDWPSAPFESGEK